ncbi:MAG TPA: transketolase [Ferruginibacter sp.]|nr:transketolase [Ferruginibacter sp.]HRO05411.1 transketolase [Ferruginibacter sp.]HRO96127.1 transketolase [Ferruginibacter sp.]HRP48888.1 transketolase [Ferruginibacter sp.]
MKNIEALESMATQVRRDIVRMVHAVQSGHPGGSLGCTEFLTALYFKVMNRKMPFQMDGIGEDLFFLSNGHITPVYYSVLARAGYFPIEELKTFRKINTRLQGHPTTHEDLPGVRIASGSLGQGMSVAVGAAKAKKLNGDNTLVYSLHGDGELNEGQNWEAILFAAHHRIDNIISTIDVNGQQIDGSTNQVMNLDPLRDKFIAFNWEVMEMEGNQMQAVVEGLEHAKTLTGKGKPVVILMKTDMGHGVDFMAGTHEWHGIAPNDEQLERALAQLPETIGDY